MWEVVDSIPKST
ncbi:hypothetical protein LINPERPRIM_LOCUS14930 [Linum perenne]